MTNGRKEWQLLHPKHKFPLSNTNLPLGIINVLGQPRETFEEIDILGEDVAYNNLYELLLIGRFDKLASCRAYLKEANEVFETNYCIEDLIFVTEDNKKVFYILLDGGRRYRSCILLRDVGCESCHKKFGPGGCYEKHFGDLNVEARIFFNPSPEDFIDRQFCANIHHRVPPYEEARALYRLFNLRKRKNSTYTITEFAKRIRKSPDTIRQDLRFCESPLYLQESVRKEEISWGIGLEIVRLYGQGFNEQELEYWIKRAIVGNYKVYDFRKVVTEVIKNRNSGQTALFSAEYLKEMGKDYFRKIVERHIIMILWSLIHYFAKVINLFRDDKLGKTDSPFSHRSPLKVFRKLIDLLENLYPHLQSLLPKKEVIRTKKVIKKTKKLVSELEKNVQK